MSEIPWFKLELNVTKHAALWKSLVRDWFPDDPTIGERDFASIVQTMRVSDELKHSVVPTDRFGGTFVYRAPDSIMRGAVAGSANVDTPAWPSIRSSVYALRYTSNALCFDSESVFLLVSKTTKITSPLRRQQIFNECTTWSTVYPGTHSQFQLRATDQLAVWHTRRIPACSLSRLAPLLSEMTDDARVAIGRHIGQSLLSLHRLGIVHGDAHMDNVLLDEHGHAAWIGFAHSTHLSDNTRSSPKRVKLDMKTNSLMDCVHQMQHDPYYVDKLRFVYSMRNEERSVAIRRGFSEVFYEPALASAWTKEIESAFEKQFAESFDILMPSPELDQFWKVYDDQRGKIVLKPEANAQLPTNRCFTSEGLQPYRHPDTSYYAHQLAAVLQLRVREGDDPVDAIVSMTMEPMRVVFHFGWPNQIRSADAFTSQYVPIIHDSANKTKAAVGEMRFSSNDGCLVRDGKLLPQVPLITWNSCVSQFGLAVLASHLKVQVVHDTSQNQIRVMYDYRFVPDIGATVVRLIRANIPHLPFPLATSLITKPSFDCRIVVAKHPGVPLAGLIRFGMSSSLQRAVAKKIGLFLKALHAAGWVHGRMFASNVLVDPRTANVLITGFHHATDKPNGPLCICSNRDWTFILESTKSCHVLHKSLLAEKKNDIIVLK